MTHTGDAPEKGVLSIGYLRWATLFVPKYRAQMREALHQQCVRTDGARPWFGAGALITHYTYGLTGVSLCWRSMGETTSSEPRTLIGHTCRRCTRTWRNAVRAWLADPQTVHVIRVGKMVLVDAAGQRTSERVLVCATCVQADDGATEPASWPCRYADAAAIEKAAPLVEAWGREQDRKAAWRQVYDAAYTHATGRSAHERSETGRLAPIDFDANRAAAEVADQAHPQPADIEQTLAPLGMWSR